MNNDKNNYGLDKGKYQVFLFVCPSNIPFNFASHSWFVINKQGSTQRWEVLFRKIKRETSWGHLYMNFFPLFSGIEIFPFSQKYFWKGKLLGKMEGEIAKQIAEFIENSPKAYPYCDKYSLIGPNSNTFVQWVLSNFPEFKIELPWNSFGKNYKVKEFVVIEKLEMSISKLENFNEEPITFVETQNVKSGVVCDVYSFEKDDSKDLGIVTVSKGSKTPLQKVLKGDKTIEGFLSGSGTLTITKQGGEIEKYDFSNSTPKIEVEVEIGQTMQWEANEDLVFYEICYPPYQDGRFENIS